jgi:hypothetical protein
MQVKVERLIRAIEYEGANPSDISKQFSDLFLEMEPLYPGHGLEGFSEEKTDKKWPREMRGKREF